MQKQISFFERNVEWFALGLGGLFLLFMVYQYVLNVPVKETVDGKELTAGEIDKATMEGPVEKLRIEIANTNMPRIRQGEYVQRFVAMIQGSSQRLPQLAGTQIASHPMTNDLIATDETQQPGVASKKPVTDLPIPPVATFVAYTDGRSRVTWPDPTWVPRNPPRANDAPKMLEADKDWWSGAWKINSEDLYKAFAKAFDEDKINAANLDPAYFMKTSIVDVQLERRQVLPGGKFGTVEVVRPLENSLKPPFPAGKEPGDAEVKQYLEFVTQNAADVVEPAFFEVKLGDLWVMPSEENDALVAEMRQANKEQRKELKAKQLADKKAQAQQNAVQRRSMIRNASAAGEIDLDMDEMMPERGRSYVRPPVTPYRPPSQSGLRPRTGIPAAQQPLVQAAAGQFPVMPDMGEIRVVTHDDTVEAGKTYQYRLRYQIYNPVYKSTAADPKLTKAFNIPSAYSAWTSPVKIRDKVEFFIAKVSGDKADFEVFTWKEGTTRQSRITVGAGDAISTTGWSLVDARGRGDKSYGLIVDDSGDVIKRSPSVDLNSTRYEDLQAEVEASKTQVGMAP